MSNEWNIDNIRKIAGLPLMESRFDNDDDEDPDAKVASSDKRQAAFEKRNKSEIRRAEKEAENKEKVAARKAAEEKQPAADVKKVEPKAEEKPAETKEEPKAEDKEEGDARSSSRGRKPSDSSKMGQARKWIQDHPSATRGEFMKHAESFNMSRHYANAFFYSVKKKMKVEECYILVHPTLPSFVLAENREINQMQWVDPTSPLEPMIFESREEAEKIAKYMSEWKSQYVDILTVTLTD